MGKIAGLILAGGQGRRLGGVDKALLHLHGETLLARASARLAPQVEALALSANGDPARFAAFTLPVLADSYADIGPLAGVAAGLAWAAAQGAEALLTVPVDTPFFPANLAALLAPGPAAASWRGRTHYLMALWPVAFLPVLTAHLATTTNYAVRHALALAGARTVEIPGENDPFLNLNTPEDWAAAEARLG